jgi:hypothetical protein
VSEQPERGERREVARYVWIAGIAVLVLAAIWVLLRTFVVNFMDARPL